VAAQLWHKLINNPDDLRISATEYVPWKLGFWWTGNAKLKEVTKLCSQRFYH
jgi:hypothetical protein